MIHVEDWLYMGECVVDIWIFLREDRRKNGYQWETPAFAYGRRALGKTDVEELLRSAGFHSVSFLPQQSPWNPYEVVAQTSKLDDTVHRQRIRPPVSIRRQINYTRMNQI